MNRSLFVFTAAVLFTTAPFLWSESLVKEGPKEIKFQSATLKAGTQRMLGQATLSVVPKQLEGAECLVPERGKGDAPGAAYSFTLSSDAVVYLFVLKRGQNVVSSEWTDTGWTAESKHPQLEAPLVDAIYKKTFRAGETVRVPEHKGKDGATFGIPHLVALVPNKKVSQSRLWIEAEHFSIPGPWAVVDNFLMGQTDQATRSRDESSAFTLISVPEDGTYKLWVRAKDYSKQDPGKRFFNMEIAGKPSPRTFGTHGKEGFEWEEGGTFDLKKGENILSAIDTSGFYARFDKMLLTTEMNYVPKGNGEAENVEHIKPKTFFAAASSDNSPLVFGAPVPTKPVSELKNDRYLLTFSEFEANGEKAISPAVYIDGGKTLVSEARQSYFAFLYSRQDHSLYSPRSSHSPYFSVDAELKIGDTLRKGNIRTQDPFIGSEVKCFFYPDKIVSQSGDEIVLSKETKFFTAEIRYRFQNGHPFVDLTVKPKDNGFATVAAYAFEPKSKDECSFFLLPYYYQGKRFPDDMLLLPSSAATAPLSLIETKPKGTTLTTALVANIKDEAFKWLSFNNSFAALAVQNAEKQLQSGIFSPVPATDKYACKKDSPIHLSFSLYASHKAWNEAFSETAFELMYLSDYRKNYPCSLNDAALNMFDLMMNDKASGWDARHKGFIQIENKNTVSQSSLLTMMEMYYLTGDEKIYDERVMPTAAFLFSRGTQHFPTDPHEYGAAYVSKVDLDGPVKLYGTSTYQGFDKMYKGRTSALYYDALKPDGSAKINNGYNTIPTWSEELYAYYLTGDQNYRESAIRGAYLYLTNRILAAPTQPRDYQNFIRLNIPPYFWAFVDIYEETKDPAFLEAAKIGADYVLSTLYLHPNPFDKTYSVTRKEIYDNSRTEAWWYNDKHFRLGFDTEKLPANTTGFSPVEDYIRNPKDIREETVPAWIVSPAGLGIEQPCTMDRGRRPEGRRDIDSPYYPIRNSCEVAYLMRLYGYTKEKRYWTYARNGIIGQFGNYPGYYINLLSTTERQTNYTSVGPDLSDIYYHHIPVHLGFTLDYLVTSAEVRSDWKINFPSVLQQGYVWFINRMVGHEPGVFYGDTGVLPALQRGLISLDTIQLNYLTAYGKDHFYIFLMNEEDKVVDANLRLNETLLGVGDPNGAVTLIADNGTPVQGKLSKASVNVKVSPKGVLAIKIPRTTLKDTKFLTPAKTEIVRDKGSFLREKDADLGARIQALLIAHPIKDYYDAFVNVDFLDAKSVVVKYSTDGKTWSESKTPGFPFETTIRVKDIKAPFYFKVEKTGVDGSTSASKQYQLKFAVK